MELTTMKEMNGFKFDTAGGEQISIQFPFLLGDSQSLNTHYLCVPYVGFPPQNGSRSTQTNGLGLPTFLSGVQLMHALKL
jgi:hypothetical protein